MLRIVVADIIADKIILNRPIERLIDCFENFDGKLFIAVTSHFALINIQNLQTSLYSWLIFEFNTAYNKTNAKTLNFLEI